VLVKSWKEGDQIRAQFHLLRILHESETDIEKWNPKKKIKDLKVLPYESLTNEENHWAGEVQGNEVGFFGNWIFFIGLFVFLLNKGVFHPSGILEGTWIIYLITIVWGYFNFKSKLIRSKKPLESKVNELMSFKRKLIKEGKNRVKQQLTELDKALGKYSTWKTLSPIAFENALKRKLNNLGMKVDTTKTSGDGGIDLEGHDENKNPVLIQAKKYSKPVGVSVVREMIGVRQNYQDNPRTVIYSLEGFTKGAYDLAKAHNVELKSIRDDLIRR
jgi:HJR/Mrr/RecB family endonuclease